MDSKELLESRPSGILMHITSLPSAYGIGDLGHDAYQFVDFLAATGQKLWQILPLNPTALFARNSPYSSESAFAGNPLVISPRMLMEEGWLTEGDLPSTDYDEHAVDFETVTADKREIIDIVYRRFKERADSEQQRDFTRFIHDYQGWLGDYALFLVLKQKSEYQPWHRWLEKKRKHRGLDRYHGLYADEIRYVQFQQYLFHRQWFALKEYANSRGIAIIGDFPIYVNLDSADVWANQENFRLQGLLEEGRLRVASGVPGESRWGHPLYNWDYLKQSGYAWWIQRIGHNFELYDMLRIDHFIGFFRYGEMDHRVPEETQGEWKEGPGEEFVRALISHFGRLPIIAEDLGNVPREMLRVMNRLQLAGMRVQLYGFSFDPAHIHHPAFYGKNVVAYAGGTHDNNTARGWWKEEATPEYRGNLVNHLDDLETGESRSKDAERWPLTRIGDVNEENVHWALIKSALSSSANWVLTQMQDLLGLGSEARMNTFRTSGPQPRNWTWKLSQIPDDPAVAERLKQLTARYRSPGYPVPEETKERTRQKLLKIVGKLPETAGREVQIAAGAVQLPVERDSIAAYGVSAGGERYLAVVPQSEGFPVDGPPGPRTRGKVVSEESFRHLTGQTGGELNGDYRVWDVLRTTICVSSIEEKGDGAPVGSRYQTVPVRLLAEWGMVREVPEEGQALQLVKVDYPFILQIPLRFLGWRVLPKEEFFGRFERLLDVLAERIGLQKGDVIWLLGVHPISDLGRRLNTEFPANDLYRVRTGDTEIVVRGQGTYRGREGMTASLFSITDFIDTETIELVRDLEKRILKPRGLAFLVDFPGHVAPDGKLVTERPNFFKPFGFDGGEPADWEWERGRHLRIPPGLPDGEVLNTRGVNLDNSPLSNAFLVKIPDPAGTWKRLLDEERYIWGMDDEAPGRIRILLRHHVGIGPMSDTAALNLWKPEVQNWILGAVQTWIDAGATGFRIDLAAHFPGELLAEFEHLFPGHLFLKEDYQRSPGYHRIHERHGMRGFYNHTEWWEFVLHSLSQEAGASEAMSFLRWQTEEAGTLGEGIFVNYLGNHDEQLPLLMFHGDVKRYLAAAAMYLFMPGMALTYLPEIFGWQWIKDEEHVEDLSQRRGIKREYTFEQFLSLALNETHHGADQVLDVLGLPYNSRVLDGFGALHQAAHRDLITKSRGFRVLSGDHPFVAFARYDAVQQAVIVINYSEKLQTGTIAIPEMEGFKEAQVATTDLLPWEVRLYTRVKGESSFQMERLANAQDHPSRPGPTGNP
jgi:4-alpha-glucanotransferase